VTISRQKQTDHCAQQGRRRGNIHRLDQRRQVFRHISGQKVPAFNRFADHVSGEIENVRQPSQKPACIAVARGIKAAHQQRHKKDQQHQIHPALRSGQRQIAVLNPCSVGVGMRCRSPWEAFT